MKRTLMLPALAGFLVLTGCEGGGPQTPDLLSLDPVATDQEVTVDSQLVGAWESSDSGDQACLILRNGDKGYHIAYFGGGSPVGFDGRLFQAGNARLLELTPTDGDDFHVKGHALARIWMDGGKLRWAFLDTEWLMQQASQLSNHMADNHMLLTAPGSMVRSFIGKYAEDDRAYANPVTWQKAQ